MKSLTFFLFQKPAMFLTNIGQYILFTQFVVSLLQTQDTTEPNLTRLRRNPHNRLIQGGPYSLVSYTEVYQVYRDVSSIQGYIQYTGIYPVYRGISSIQGYIQYTGIYSVYQGISSIQGYIKYTGIYPVNKGISSIQGYIQ